MHRQPAEHLRIRTTDRADRGAELESPRVPLGEPDQLRLYQKRRRGGIAHAPVLRAASTCRARRSSATCSTGWSIRTSAIITTRRCFCGVTSAWASSSRTSSSRAGHHGSCSSYSGTLLHGLRQMQQRDVFDSLKRITCSPTYRQAVEWLGTPRGHAVADNGVIGRMSRPGSIILPPDSALRRSRVCVAFRRQMALPNHPDVAYEFVKALKRLRLHLAPGAGAHNRVAEQRPGASAQAHPASAHLSQFPWREPEHHRHH
jgi:hypothetical protein